MRELPVHDTICTMENSTAKRTLLVAWIVSAALVGYLDFVTGPYVSLTLFYLAPVVGAAWFGRRRDGITVALVAGAVSVCSDLLVGNANTQATLIWNTVSRTVVLLIAAVVVNRVRTDRRALEMMHAQRVRSLQLLERGLAGPARELLELADRWDGGTDQLRAMLRPRAETISFMARDFTEMVLLQRGHLSLERGKVDLLALVQDVRRDAMRERRVTVVAPNDRVLVLADGARLRQSIASLLGLLGGGDELTLTLTRHGETAELLISSQGLPGEGTHRAETRDDISLSVELARLIFRAQGGSLEVLRNPITRSLQATARLPLA